MIVDAIKFPLGEDCSEAGRGGGCRVPAQLRWGQSHDSSSCKVTWTWGLTDSVRMVDRSYSESCKYSRSILQGVDVLQCQIIQTMADNAAYIHTQPDGLPCAISGHKATNPILVRRSTLPSLATTANQSPRRSGRRVTFSISSTLIEYSQRETCEKTASRPQQTTSNIMSHHHSSQVSADLIWEISRMWNCAPKRQMGDNY